MPPESKSILPSHEHVSLSEKSIALNTRLALGGNALEVTNTQVAKVGSSQELRTSFEQTHTNTESRIAKASVRKRLEYWEKQGITDESEQIKKWKGDVVTLCQSKTNKKMIDTLATHKIGGIDWKQISDEQVGKLYETYFGASEQQTITLKKPDGTTMQIPSGTSTFINEVVKVYTKEDGTIDYTSLHRDRQALEFAAGIFGIEDLLFEYIDTITTLQDEERTQELINKANHNFTTNDHRPTTDNQTTPTSPRLRGANRINTLTTYEEEQLRLLSEGYEVKEEEIPLTPTQEPTTKEPIVVKPKIEKPIRINVVKKPGKKEDLVRIIDQNFPKPIVITIEDIKKLPKPEEIKVDLKPTLTELNLSEQFTNRQQLDEHTAITPLIPLTGLSDERGNYFYFSLAQKQNNGSTQYSSCLILQNNQNEYIPVGHVDYGTLPTEPTKAACCMSLVDDILKSLPEASQPNHAKIINDFFCQKGSDYAVHINPNFKGKGLGKMLWELSLAQAEIEKINIIEIIADATVGKDPDKPGDSFYKHLGAYPIFYIIRPEVVTIPGHEPVTKTPDLVSGENLFASTCLTDQQINNLRNVFIPKPEPEIIRPVLGEAQITIDTKDLAFQQEEQEITGLVKEQLEFITFMTENAEEPETLDIVVHPSETAKRSLRELPNQDEYDAVFGQPSPSHETVVFDNSVFGFLDYYNRRLQDQDDPTNRKERGLLFMGQRCQTQNGRKWTHITGVMPQWNQNRHSGRKTIIPSEFAEANRIANRDNPNNITVAWSHTHPSWNPGPSSDDDFIINNFSMIALIDNPLDGRIGIYNNEGGIIQNLGGFIILKPKLEPGDSYDKDQLYHDRTYWTGQNIGDGSGRIIPPTL